MSKNVLKIINEYSLERKCLICGLTKWNNLDIPLEIHHINGIHSDNSFENLLILCPNCHAQTDNYRGKNRKKNLKLIYYCNECGKELYEKTITGLCKSCYGKLELKNSKCPEKEILLNDYKELKSYAAVGRKHGVSDKTAKKWIKNYE